MMKESISLYSIFRKALGELNKQIVDHGERVAYLFLMMSKLREVKDEDYIEKMFIVCFTHDIGSYKTENYSQMLRYDEDYSLEHSIYGYLFMKHFSPLRDDSKVILYHHANHGEKDDNKSSMFNDGVLIHLLDRVDIFNTNNDGDVLKTLKAVQSLSGVVFNPEDVEDLLKLERKYKVIEKLNSGEYKETVKDYFDDEDRIKRLLEPVADMMTYEIDFRSGQTVIHTATTSVIAKILAEKMDLDNKAVINITYAAKLHDVGKLKMPSDILDKPDRLSEDEYKVMKKHVQYTKEMIEELSPKDITTIAYRHHERLDGSGYPKGLKAEDLSVSDRILQVADVSSALMYKRTYREAMKKEEVIKTLNKEAYNNKLDGEVVKTFITHYDKIVVATSKVSDSVIKRYEDLKKEYTDYLKKYTKLDRISRDEFDLLAAKRR